MVDINYKTLEKPLEKLFKKCVSERVFPGASLGISYIKDGECEKKIFCYGKKDDSEILVNKKTFYDCASLTKPLVTVLSLLVLIEEKKIFWDEKLESLLSCVVPKDKKELQLFHLMSHSSGLPAHRPYYTHLNAISPELRKKEIIKLILQEKLLHLPGEKNIYSDLGYILLGIIIEEKSGNNLDEFWQKKIINPLNLQKKLLFPKTHEINKNIFASTGYCSTIDEKLYGVVHDENCRILGGVTGHAGLFGTAEGVLLLCENILMGYCNLFRHPSFSNETLRNVLEKKKNSSWTPGFDTPSETCSSSGRYFTKESVGHLGFTGTSFWIDLQQRIIIVLLSNRVFGGVENEQIRKIRPIVHDLIMKKRE
jgi:serine-type D-Ala-D-Ala carboxypeptidase